MTLLIYLKNQCPDSDINQGCSIDMEQNFDILFTDVETAKELKVPEISGDKSG